MRLTASQLGVSEKELVTRQALFDGANRIEEGAYKIDAAILADGADDS
jgi:hypothetical protein